LPKNKTVSSVLPEFSISQRPLKEDWCKSALFMLQGADY